MRRVCLIALKVDDLESVGYADQADHFSTTLPARLPLHDDVDDFLGLESRRTKRGVQVNQPCYAKKIVENAGFGATTPTTTPLPAGFYAESTYVSKTQGLTAAGLDFLKVTSEVGNLTKTMPWLHCSYDCSSSVARPSAVLPDAPNARHRTALARTLRFLKGRTRLGLTFSKRLAFSLLVAALRPMPASLTLELTAFAALSACCDASNAREPHPGTGGLCRSRRAGLIFGSGAVVQGFSETQTATALSTFEAELYAQCLTIRRLSRLPAPRLYRSQRVSGPQPRLYGLAGCPRPPHQRPYEQPHPAHRGQHGPHLRRVRFRLGDSRLTPVPLSSLHNPFSFSRATSTKEQAWHSPFPFPPFAGKFISTTPRSRVHSTLLLRLRGSSLSLSLPFQNAGNRKLVALAAGSTEHTYKAPPGNPEERPTPIAEATAPGPGPWPRSQTWRDATPVRGHSSGTPRLGHFFL